MSVETFLEHELGLVKGLFASDWNMIVVRGVHEVQQKLTLAYGDAAVATCQSLATNTSMTGLQKLDYVASAIVATALKDGWKIEAKVLYHLAVSIASQAFLQMEPSIGTSIVAIAAAASSSPIVGVVATLAAPIVQAEADAIAAKIDPPAPLEPPAAPAAPAPALG